MTYTEVYTVFNVTCNTCNSAIQPTEQMALCKSRDEAWTYGLALHNNLVKTCSNPVLMVSISAMLVDNAILEQLEKSFREQQTVEKKGFVM